MAVERRDFIGQQLEVGDSVAYSAPYGRSKELRLGKVTGFTPQKVRVNGSLKDISGVVKVSQEYIKNTIPLNRIQLI